MRVGLGVRKNGARAIPSRIFDLFPVLKKMLNRRGGDLSGGQQQQLAIGRALVLEPKLLILDEPTEGIQPNIVHEIGDIVLRLNKEEGLTVLLVEQKLPFARRVASEFCILDKGPPCSRRTDWRAHGRSGTRPSERVTNRAVSVAVVMVMIVVIVAMGMRRRWAAVLKPSIPARAAPSATRSHDPVPRRFLDS